MKNEDKPEKNEYLSIAQREFNSAKEEYFKNKPKPNNEREAHKEIEEFIYWYNNKRKQSDTGKTPSEMYKEIYVEEDIAEDVNGEIIELIEKLQKYDEIDEELDYDYIKEDLKDTIEDLTFKGELALGDLHFLIGFSDNISCSLALEIIRAIKNPKSISELIEFIKENEYDEMDIYGGLCDEACFALTEIGEDSIDSLIKEIKNNIKNKEYYDYLIESLINIKSDRVYEFMRGLLEDYIKDCKKYDDWFEIIPFIIGFHEQNNVEALPQLKRLLELKKWERDEKIEIDEVIFHLENPEKYEIEFNKFLEEMKKSFEQFKINEKVGRNDLCPCGSGKKYKRCCLNKGVLDNKEYVSLKEEYEDD